MYCETSDYKEFETAQEEVAQLEVEFRNGQLDRLAPSISLFAKAQFEQLPPESKEKHNIGTILTTVKQGIVQARSIDCRNEMTDQMKAINDEIWFCGERGEYDRNQIAINWTAQHAENWRRWRIKEYLYLVDQRIDIINSILEAS